VNFSIHIAARLRQVCYSKTYMSFLSRNAYFDLCLLSMSTARYDLVFVFLFVQVCDGGDSGGDLPVLLMTGCREDGTVFVVNDELLSQGLALPPQ